ncbi:MAG: hypothetical protein AAFQ01_04245 [Bacteroidota bacterium]
MGWQPQRVARPAISCPAAPTSFGNLPRLHAPNAGLETRAVFVGHLPVVAERGAGVAGAIGDALAVGGVVGVRGEAAAVHESTHIARQVMDEVVMTPPDGFSPECHKYLYDLINLKNLKQKLLSFRPIVNGLYGSHTTLLLSQDSFSRQYLSVARHSVPYYLDGK